MLIFFSILQQPAKIELDSNWDFIFHLATFARLLLLLSLLLLLLVYCIKQHISAFLSSLQYSSFKFIIIDIVGYSRFTSPLVVALFRRLSSSLVHIIILYYNILDYIIFVNQRYLKLKPRLANKLLRVSIWITFLYITQPIQTNKQTNQPTNQTNPIQSNPNVIATKLQTKHIHTNTSKLEHKL